MAVNDDFDPTPPAPRRGPRRRAWINGLSARLLLLTAAFAIAVDLLILFPAAASFHERWVTDRVRAAEVASLVVEAAPYATVEDSLADRLLVGVGADTVVLQENGIRRLLRGTPKEGATPHLIDLRESDLAARLLDPWLTLLGPDDRRIQVIAAPRWRSGDFIDIVAEAAPLKAELRTYVLQIVFASLVISVLAGGLLYAGLVILVLEPVRRVTQTIERFRDDPEADPRPIRHERVDEIGRVEDELNRMQQEVRSALRSRARLAALGEAVAKISHDLRNMLTAAQMASDRLADSGDPTVARALPRLERALDRALNLAQDVLAYGRSEEPRPDPRPLRLVPAIHAAAEDAGLTDQGVRLIQRAPSRLRVEADPEHLHRILVNLMRNAREAIEADPERDGIGRVSLSAVRTGDKVEIRVRDDGPGLPARARERLFLPFQGSTRRNGAGLGLPIARELAQAGGGDLVLDVTGPGGTVFLLTLPAQH
ncbi:sensor histidine kinase [Brevundimonas aveniformis]|uniref:sensor histidine kinase n=1 Tax=Brevundimonas aveniformis TaxID=370977 RepID=UPI003CD0E0C0